MPYVYSEINHIPYAYVQKVNIGFGGHIGRHLEKKHTLSGPILVPFMYLLHTYVIHFRQKVQTDTTSHCYVTRISVDTGTHGGCVNNQERHKL